MCVSLGAACAHVCVCVCDEEWECVVKAGKVVAVLRGLFGPGSRCVFV